MAPGRISLLLAPARLLGLAAAAVLLAVFAGCQVNQGAPDLVNGKKKFSEKCGSCHVLGRAGTQGVAGPNLDTAFQAAVKDGMGRGTIRGVVHSQILHPRVSSAMPAGLVKGQDAHDVAAYVARAASRPGKDTGALVLGPTSGPGAVFVQEGCGSCHVLAAAQTSGTTGPNLDQVLPGKSPEEIMESIVNPDAKIESGFQAGVMPKDYGQRIDPQQLKELSEYLSRLGR